MPRLSGDVNDEGLRASMEAHQRFIEDFYTQEVAGGPRGVELSEDRIRQSQLMRGGMTARNIASPSAIASLESVDVATLEENERSKYSKTRTMCCTSSDAKTIISMHHMLQRLWHSNSRGRQRGSVASA